MTEIAQKEAVIELHYLPCIQYFQLISRMDKVYIDVSSKFLKQTYRNRCRIRGANKVDQLVLPVLTASKGGTLQDIQIDNNQTWRKDHWRGLMSSYGRAPYFEHFSYLFEEIFFADVNSLSAFNEQLLTLCLRLLQLDTEVVFVRDQSLLDGFDGFDARELIHPKKVFDKFDMKYYVQVFGNEFEENLSVVDLLFCEGQNSISLL